jgi:iron complex outermembrane receptor protein
MIRQKSISRFTCIILLVILSGPAYAQAPKSLTPGELKELSMEDLMNIEVTSVSKRPEKLSDVASAIQVITRDDILRSAATNVPEALRLAPNLQVTQLNSHHWNISARGFNSAFSNKLLVMIDGRTVYSPLFAGVFWDVQNVLLEDVERIEVISGPGGTLWGANAVNGVINIITRKAKDTQGLFVSAGSGSVLKAMGEARYGGNIGENISYRIYGQHYNRKPTLLPDGNDNIDKWQITQGGFQLDWDTKGKDLFSLQGNFYGGVEHNTPKSSVVDGQNIMGRWTHTFSETSELIVQAYFDRTWRVDIPSTIDDQLQTYDIDIQHRFAAGKKHTLIWGAGYRLMDDDTWNRTQYVGFLPPNRIMNLFSSFIQDEISLLPDRLKLTVGSKLQHTNFTGFEIQPSARLAWNPIQHQTLWTAVSRAVRAPSRIDVDYHIPAYPVAPPAPSVAGGPNFVSEKVIAYELGYRIQPSSRASLSIAAFYNVYDDLYSVEALPGTSTFQIQNGVEGHSAGAELSGNLQLSDFWRIRGGYTYFSKKLQNKPTNLGDPSLLASLGMDAENQIVLQSMLDLPWNFKLDLTSRFVDRLPQTQYNPRNPSYVNLDARLAWRSKKFELSVSGQDLLKDTHVEIGNKQIKRGVYGRITWRM